MMDLEQFRLVARALYYGVCVLAVLRGDRPLRYVGAAIVANALLSPLLQRPEALTEPQYGVLVADVALLAALAGILVRDRRWWLVAALGFWLISTLTHLAALIGSPISPYATATARLLWAFGMVGAVGWGVAACERRRALSGYEHEVRAMIAERGEAFVRAELDRQHLTAASPAERARAARRLAALQRMTLTERRYGFM